MFVAKYLLQTLPRGIKPVLLSNGDTRLVIGIPGKIFFVTISSMLVGIGFWGMYLSDGNERYLLSPIFFLLMFFGGALGYQVLTQKILVNNVGVQGVNFYGRKEYISWTEIRAVEYDQSWLGIRLIDGGGRSVYVTSMACGFPIFIEKLRNKTTQSDWTEGAIKFCNLQLKNEPNKRN